MDIKDWYDLIIHVQKNYHKYFSTLKSPKRADLTYSTSSIYVCRKRGIIPPRPVDMKDYMVESSHDMYAMQNA